MKTRSDNKKMSPRPTDDDNDDDDDDDNDGDGNDDGDDVEGDKEDSDSSKIWTCESALQDLRQNYGNIDHPIAYAAPNAIHKFYLGRLTLREIKDFLSTIRSYAANFEYHRSLTNPVFTYR